MTAAVGAGVEAAVGGAVPGGFGAGVMAGRMTNFMRALKALVIVMGILIVAGTAVIAVTLARRSADDGAARTGGDAAVAAPRIELPAGARVVETALDGTRIALRIVLADGTERIIVIDTETGRRTGAVDVVPAAAAAGARR